MISKRVELKFKLGTAMAFGNYFFPRMGTTFFIADCGLRITDCGLRIADYGLPGRCNATAEIPVRPSRSDGRAPDRPGLTRIVMRPQNVVCLQAVPFLTAAALAEAAGQGVRLLLQ